jgi:hypothetical protein
MQPASRLPVSSLLTVTAMLNRIMSADVPHLMRDDAEALWQALPAAGTLPETQAGAWLLRRRRSLLHWVIEVERANPDGIHAYCPRVTVAMLRYTLFGRPVDVLRRTGPRLALPVWPGLLVCLDLSLWRNWKRVAA